MANFFEKKINGYSCNFDLLNETVKDQAGASNYYAWVKNRYKTYFDNADAVTRSKFYIRYHRAKKLLYSSAQMLMEAKCSLENECVVGFYYLIYYALFQAMQANLILCIEYDDNRVLQLSHYNVKNYFDEQFCKNQKCPLDDEIVTLIEALRIYREYYSYAMPFNLSNKAIVDIIIVEKYIRLCFQLFNLHTFIIWQEISRGTFMFDSLHERELKNYFDASCNRLECTSLTDDADINVWKEFKKYNGGEILPLLISYDHDFDEFGTYDRDVYHTMKIPRTQNIISKALAFIYDAIH